ncbi:MAG: SRPBCC family protein [Terriglobia bacterium]|jgi:hypothetical protein
MSTSRGVRVSHEYTQTNDAPPAQVFPLLCPVREADWVPNWKYSLIYSDSGVAEDGCVFTTPNESGTETVWMVTRYDPASLTIAYAWVEPGMIATQLRIALAPAPGRKTRSHIRFVYTALSEAGNAVVDRYTQAWFRKKMQAWEEAINYHLRTGKLVPAAAWE